MKILKGIVFLVLALVAIILIVALFVKRDYQLERSVTINKPVGEVFNYVKYLKNQDNFSIWNKLDTAMQKSYTGTDGTVGFVYAWDGNKKAGKGEQEIKGIDENKKVDIALRFEKPFESNMDSYLATEQVSDNQTKVSWGMKGTNSYPMNIMNLAIPSMIGKDLDSNLNSLKAVLEN